MSAGSRWSHETIRFWWNRFGPIFAGWDPQEADRPNACVVGLSVAP